MSRLHPKITITLFREEKCFGPGIAALLSAVKEHRSLRSAAISMDMAYSKAWKILRNCEKELNCKLLQSTIGGQHGGGGIAQGHNAGVPGDIGVVAQIGTVNQRAVTGDRQGEEGLTQSKHPHHRVAQTGKVKSEYIAVGVRCSGQGEQINGKAQEQNVEQGDHDLVGKFDATANAERHNCDGENHADHLPN